MKRNLCLLPFLLAAPVYSADNSDLLKLLPSGTQVAFGIKVHAVLNSELAKDLTAEVKGQAADWQKLIALSGFDPMTDLDEILIGSTAAGENPPTLILARGKFDVEKLTPNAELYNGVRLVTSQNPKAPGIYGFLDATTAIAGDPGTVKAAIDHRSEAASLEAKLASQITDYRDHYDIWAIVNRPEGLAKLVPKATGGTTQGLDAIDRFQFGVSVHGGIDLAAEVHARSAKDAEQLAAALQFLDAMTKASSATPKGTRFAFRQSADGTLKVTLAISGEELKKQIERQRLAGVQWSMGPSPARPKAATATAGPTVSAQPVLPPLAEQPVTPAPGVQPVLPPVTQPQAPGAVKPPPKPVAPGAGTDEGRTGVFTLPSRQQ